MYQFIQFLEPMGMNLVRKKDLDLCRGHPKYSFEFNFATSVKNF
jgi:hypothetical protein